MRSGAVVVCLIAAAAAAGCGNSNKGGEATGKALPAQPAKSVSGTVTFCVGKDTTGSISESLKAFRKAQPKVTMKLLELPESQDDARAQVVQRERAKSPECDVIGMDPTWVAEFAAQGWLRDVSATIQEVKGDYVPSTVASAFYDGKYWGFPYVSDTGFLYYRTDKVHAAPTSWEQVYANAKTAGGLVYQGSKYEGLTCSFLEMLFGAGGSVLSSDAKSVTIDSPEARKALSLMVSGLKDGAVSKAVLTYEEEDARRAFEGGRAALMRNWPYAYALGKKSAIKAKFAVEPVPGFQGHPGASVLGGYDLGISAFSRNPDGAVAFARFMGGPVAQRIAGVRSFPPTRVSAYDDPAVRKAIPFAATLRKAISQARPRPVSPVYPEISSAIQSHVYAALQGRQSVDDAVSGMAADIGKALKTF